jgi:hypothetical protein
MSGGVLQSQGELMEKYREIVAQYRLLPSEYLQYRKAIELCCLLLTALA